MLDYDCDVAAHVKKNDYVVFTGEKTLRREIHENHFLYFAL